MCISPIPIPNINHTSKYISPKNKILNKYTKYIKVPCGVCKECIAQAQMELVQRVQMESLNNYIYMATLTYKESTLPRLQTPPYTDYITGERKDGYIYRYAKYQDATEMIKRIRNENKFGIPFKYLIVTERGSQRQRPHFHILILFRKKDIGNYNDCINFEQKHKWLLLNEWKRNIGTRHYPIYQELCEYRESYRGGKLHTTYDFHYVNPLLTKGGVTDAAFYVLKYMLKTQGNLNTKRALYLNYDKVEAEIIWNKIKNRVEYSLGFGLDVDYTNGKDRTIKAENCNKKIIDYLKNCIERSKANMTDYAYYYCPERLNTFPMADYYKKKGFIYTMEDEQYFYEKNPEEYMNKKILGKQRTGDQLQKQIHEFEKILKQTEKDDIADSFDELLQTT